MQRAIETIFVPSNKNPQEVYKHWLANGGKERKRPIPKYEDVFGGVRIIISYEVTDARRTG
jgi:hypothetical protein